MSTVRPKNEHTYKNNEAPTRNDPHRPMQPRWSTIMQGHEVLVSESENLQPWLLKCVSALFRWQRDSFQFSEEKGQWTHTTYFITIGMDRYARARWGTKFKRGLARCEFDSIDYERRVHDGSGWEAYRVSYQHLILWHLKNKTIPKLLDRLENCYSISYTEYGSSKKYDYTLSLIDSMIEKASI